MIFKGIDRIVNVKAQNELYFKLFWFNLAWHSNNVNI